MLFLWTAWSNGFIMLSEYRISAFLSWGPEQGADFITLSRSDSNLPPTVSPAEPVFPSIFFPPLIVFRGCILSPIQTWAILWIPPGPCQAMNPFVQCPFFALTRQRALCEDIFISGRT